VAQKVLSELSAPQWQAHRVAALMERDPSLASMVLRIANSSFYRRGPATGDIRQAVARLGGAKLQELVVGAAAMSAVQGRTKLARRWRDHCASTAAVARELSTMCSRTDPAIAFLSGLLHDMGKLLLLETGELPYESIPEALDPCDEALPAAERDRCDFDHAVLGGHVLRAWGIPDPVPQIVAWHHQPVRAYDAPAFTADHVALLRLADRVAEALDAGVAPDPRAIASSTEGEWLGISPHAYEARAESIAEARSEMLSAFGS
jgi:putative nucleotidyltransferase with HDIG domain